MRLSEDLKKRQLIYDLSDETLLSILDEGSVTFYLGADPTGKSLHIGHLSTYLMAKRLAEKGHQPILVIGGGTGLIGDPSGKSKERTLLTLEQTLANSEKIAAQVKKLLPGARIVNNYDWLKDIALIPYLRDFGKYFNLNHMLAKDSVKSRLDAGISYTEFSYQLIQSIDFLTLFERHQCTLQIGGQDQWGNITAGLDLIRKKHGAEAKAYAMVFPLVTKSDGTKFGKTADGAVWLDPHLTSPYAFYQYWINVSDEDIAMRLWQFSFASVKTIENRLNEHAQAPHLRIAQKALAEEMTELVHGKEGLSLAQAITDALFSGRFESLDKAALTMAFAGVKSARVAAGTPFLDALMAAELIASKTQGRTLLKQGALSLGGEKVSDESLTLSHTGAYHGAFHVIRRGKKEYALIEID